MLHYMKHYLSFLLPAGAAVLLASCSMNLEDDSVQSPDLVKVQNAPQFVSPASVLMDLDSAPDEALLSELAACGVVRVKPLFNMDRGDVELKKRLGMDRSFEAFLAEGVSPEEAVAGLSRIASVRTLQYNKQYRKASDCKVYPYPGPVAGTKAASDAVFNDPLLQDQWSYRNTGSKVISTSAYAGADINVKDVWTNLTTGDRSIIVAVVDEGVKFTHPDLAANMWTDSEGNHGYNFVDNGPVTWDKEKDSGHGTHCAGTIAAVNNNGIGVAGVAGGSGNGDGVRIMSCQIFSNDAGGTDAVSARAIEYAADNGASIISCSYGYDAGAIMSDSAYGKYCPHELRALRYFEGKKNNDILDGGVAIFAAGNDGKAYAAYPGALNDIISVSSFAPDFLPAYYTNYGPGCNIVAPGGEYNHRNNSGDRYLVRSAILSTVPSEVAGGPTVPDGQTDYAYMQGTSMACPHVSGIAALALSYAKKLGKKFTLKEFKDMLVTSANDFDSRLNGTKELANMSPISLGQYYKQMGTGSIDAWKLMMKIEGVPSLMVVPGSNQWVDVSSYFGTASTNLTYLSIEVLGNGTESLGLAEEPYMQYGRLFIHPTKVGSAKIRITAVAGGSEVGGDNAIGGMEVSQTISVIARNFKSDNGGWL